MDKDAVTNELAQPPGFSDPPWAFNKPVTRKEIKRWLSEVATDIERADGKTRAEARLMAKRMLKSW
jgi:hypothetical protein